MAALDLQEQEQLEAFKAWWKENRTLILGVLLIVAVALGGWRGWQFYQVKQSTAAATMFADFSRKLDSNDIKGINDTAAAITDNYPGTPYASRAALLAAQVNEQGKDIARAKTQLQWIIEHAGEPTLRDVARLRLAALLLDEMNHAEALKLLETDHTPSFDGLYADLKGDVLSAQGKQEEARLSYQLAVEKTDAKSMYRNLIQMKMDALMADKGTADK